MLLSLQALGQESSMSPPFLVSPGSQHRAVYQVPAHYQATGQAVRGSCQLQQQAGGACPPSPNVILPTSTRHARWDWERNGGLSESIPAELKPVKWLSVSISNLKPCIRLCFYMVTRSSSMLWFDQVTGSVLKSVFLSKPFLGIGGVIHIFFLSYWMFGWRKNHRCSIHKYRNFDPKLLRMPRVVTVKCCHLL